MSRKTGTRRIQLPSLRTTVIGFLVALSGAALYGIVGNRADSAFSWLLSLVTNAIQQNPWPWIIILILLVICIIISLYSWRNIAILSQTLDQAHKMLALDDSLFRILASWGPPVPPNDHDEQLKRILKETLKDATVQFDGYVERAAILLPDPSNTYLKCWADYQMPQESIDSMQFYVGNDLQILQDKEGVAGASYLSEEILVGHMVQQANGHWICEDQEQYIKFQGTRPYNPYISFVNVPIIGLSTHHVGGTNKATCLGVICFDSKRKDIFDSEEIKIVLRMFARRVATTISISQKLP